jgi:hypothetical protein
VESTAGVGIAEAVHGLVNLDFDQLLQLGLFVRVLWELAVAPVDGEVVIRPDLGHQTCAVAGLGDVVVTGVVHDGRGGAVLFGPFRIAQLLNGIAGGGLHVVGEAQGMADFVRDDETDQLALQIVGQGKSLRARVGRGGLDEVPVADEFLDVVIHAHVGAENLAAAGVVDLGAEGVFDVRREPADAGDARVLNVPIRIFARIGGVFADDGVGETGGPEGRRPIFDARLDVTLPFLRHFAADVKDNRFDGFGDFGVWILLFQAPAQ